LAGALSAGAVLNLGLPVPVMVVPLVAAGGLAFARWGGEAAVEAGPRALRWSLVPRRRRAWVAPLPMLAGEGGDRDRQPALPPAFGSLRIIDVEGAGLGVGGMAVVHDPGAATW